MPSTKVVLSNDERYDIFHSLELDSKTPGFVEVEITTLKGPTRYNVPPGTVSQIARYRIRSNGWQIAKAHWYLFPDGSIRGGPDPLYMRFDDVIISRA